MSYAGDDGFLHHVGILLDIGAFGIRERRTGMNDHLVFARELHGAHLQHARARAGKLQHVVVADNVELLRARAHARVSRVHAVHVRIDLAHIGPEAVRHRHRRGVRPTAAERGNVAVRVDALESGHHRDHAVANRIHDALVVHLHDLGLGVRAVRFDAGLAAREAHGLVAARFDGHGQKRHGNLLSRGQQAIHLASRRIVVERGG